MISKKNVNPLKESNLVLQRHAIVVLAIRRRGYGREMILLALLISRKSNSCTQPTRRFINPTDSNSDNPVSPLRQANLQA